MHVNDRKNIWQTAAVHKIKTTTSKNTDVLKTSTCNSLWADRTVYYKESTKNYAHEVVTSPFKPPNRQENQETKMMFSSNLQR